MNPGDCSLFSTTLNTPPSSIQVRYFTRQTSLPYRLSDNSKEILIEKYLIKYPYQLKKESLLDVLSQTASDKWNRNEIISLSKEESIELLTKKSLIGLDKDSGEYMRTRQEMEANYPEFGGRRFIKKKNKSKRSKNKKKRNRTRKVIKRRKRRTKKKYNKKSKHT